MRNPPAVADGAQLVDEKAGHMRPGDGFRETHTLANDVEKCSTGRYMVGVHLLHRKPTVTWPGWMYFFLLSFFY